MPFLHNYIFGRSKIVVFSPRMSKRYIANAHGNVLDACCQGEVLVTYPPTGILGKVTGGCWNTFEKYSFDSGLGMFCSFNCWKRWKDVVFGIIVIIIMYKQVNHTLLVFMWIFLGEGCLYVSWLIKNGHARMKPHPFLSDGNIKHWRWRNWNWSTHIPMGCFKN